ncbi:MAG: cytochrome P460 family protein [Gammaproteobacteria bacterium]
MKTLYIVTLVSLLTMSSAPFAAPPDRPAQAAPNGLTIPEGYKKWKLIGVSQRNDNDSLRAILGNFRAHQATYARGKWNWPEGTILAKLVWKDQKHPLWPDAVVPGELVHIEFMVKDRKKFAATGGWGFARWLGMDRKPYPNDGSECFACHTKAANSDYVFTRPAPLP